MAGTIINLSKLLIFYSYFIDWLSNNPVLLALDKTPFQMKECEIPINLKN